MTAARFHLDRRRVLRSARGVVVGLPLLDAMTDGRGHVLSGEARAATKPPVRLLTFYCANGTWTDVFFPKTPGPLTASTSSPMLAPLGPGGGAADMFPYKKRAVFTGLTAVWWTPPTSAPSRRCRPASTPRGFATPRCSAPSSRVTPSGCAACLDALRSPTPMFLAQRRP